MSDTTLPSPEKNPARVSLDLEPEHVKQLKNLKPGAMVEIVMVVKMTDFSMREPYGESEKKYVGHMSGEIDQMKMAKHSSNIFAELAKSDMSE